MKTIRERIEDAMREVGVLLIAFAPLDVALNHHRGGDSAYLLLFLGFGVSLFVGALMLECRRADRKKPLGLLIFLILGLILIMSAYIKGLGA